MANNDNLLFIVRNEEKVKSNKGTAKNIRECGKNTESLPS
jgi:hypothetical protein